MNDEQTGPWASVQEALHREMEIAVRASARDAWRCVHEAAWVSVGDQLIEAVDAERGIDGQAY